MKTATIAGVTILAMVSGCSRSADPPTPEALAKQQAAAAIARAKADVERCLAEYEVQAAAFEKLRASGDPWQAANAVRPCADRTGDARFKALVSKGEVAAYLMQARDESRPLLHRIQGLDELSAKYPSEFKGNEGLYSALQQRKAKAEEAVRKAELARKKREGVQLGMTQEEVLQSSWGKPQSVNRTTSFSGIREQWVYGRSYLYFRDGILTSIQN